MTTDKELRAEVEQLRIETFNEAIQDEIRLAVGRAVVATRETAEREQLDLLARILWGLPNGVIFISDFARAMSINDWEVVKSYDPVLKVTTFRLVNRDQAHAQALTENLRAITT